jgi:hypothetical protein
MIAKVLSQSQAIIFFANSSTYGEEPTAPLTPFRFSKIRIRIATASVVAVKEILMKRKSSLYLVVNSAENQKEAHQRNIRIGQEVTTDLLSPF